jgi:hypothetical protein
MTSIRRRLKRDSGTARRKSDVHVLIKRRAREMSWMSRPSCSMSPLQLNPYETEGRLTDLEER